MAITSEHAGRSYPATEPYQVSRAKVHEFARAIGDDNPSYGGPNPIAPPTFAFVIASTAWEAMFADPELELRLERVIHGEQKFRYDRPLRAGDEVVGVLTLDKVRVRGPMEFVTTSVDVSTVAGEQVCTVTAQLIHNREVPAPKEPKAAVRSATEEGTR
ncbi:FAS1-like dehydratase domain-containing protein [Raineyella sp.]|uniref:FAS1-like dehydratase domain-containing protein n=1 Tax=bioreactor metagenome TaxID=1076179 RepID=A0A645A239_9ZZZZ|nr:MaoC family dehydratase N-terminal domain-containing protein [Raineyella sp.]MEA5155702.1 MaoC family dehydratase N-terminal domain-containing protein [Raineyella sp.]